MRQRLLAVLGLLAFAACAPTPVVPGGGDGGGDGGGGPTCDRSSGGDYGCPCTQDSDCHGLYEYCGFDAPGCGVTGTCSQPVGAACQDYSGPPTFCGCDGTDFTNPQCPSPPSRPWVHRGPCDGGVDPEFHPCSGYVMDGYPCSDLVEGSTCPAPTMCPCGEPSASQCTCSGGHWACTPSDCPATPPGGCPTDAGTSGADGG